MDEYEQIYKESHTQAFQEATRTKPPNPIFETQPPTVDPVEKTFSRVHRTTLSQLSSGFCKALNRYQNGLNPSINPTRPECGSGEPYTTNHIFRCFAHPTEIDVRNLWLTLDCVARFVSSLTCFHYLPPLPPPPPDSTPAGLAP